MCGCLYMWCTCGVHVVYMWCTCGVHVVYMWCTCGVHVLYMWCTCGVHVVYMWCTCGVHVVYMWCTCGVHVVYMWCTCGVHVLYMWCTCAVHVVYMWCTCGNESCVMHSASLLQKIRVLPAVGKDPETQRSEMIRVSQVYLLPLILSMHTARWMEHGGCSNVQNSQNLRNGSP